MVTFCSHFHKKLITHSQVCRTSLIRSALESNDPGSFNDGSNVEIQQFGADLMNFKITRLPCKWVCNWQNVEKKLFLFGNSDIVNVMRSAQRGQNSMFDPSLDAPASVLSSALRIIAVQNTYERVEPYF